MKPLYFHKRILQTGSILGLALHLALQRSLPTSGTHPPRRPEGWAAHGHGLRSREPEQWGGVGRGKGSCTDCRIKPPDLGAGMEPHWDTDSEVGAVRQKQTLHPEPREGAAQHRKCPPPLDLNQDCPRAQLVSVPTHC